MCELVLVVMLCSNALTFNSHMQSQNIVLYNCTFEIFMYIQERIQGGGIGDSPPPEPYQRGDVKN